MSCEPLARPGTTRWAKRSSRRAAPTGGWVSGSEFGPESGDNAVLWPLVREMVMKKCMLVFSYNFHVECLLGKSSCRFLRHFLGPE